MSASRKGALETQLRRNPHLLETLTAITVTLIFSLFGTESIVQKLLFNLGSLFLGLGQDAIDFCGGVVWWCGSVIRLANCTGVLHCNNQKRTRRLTFLLFHCSFSAAIILSLTAVFVLSED